MSLFTRLSNGWKISMASFQVLKENRQLILFPILSGASMIVLTASFTMVALFSSATIETLFDTENSRVLTYLLIFGFYLINYFVAVFFNVALMHCARKYFDGEEVNLRNGLNFSMSRFSVILAWSVVAATVGTILKVIQEETGLIGKIITAVIGVVWNIATFFVVPVIAYENAGPIDAIKRSSQIMKEKWGESVAGNFSLGLIQLIALIVVAVPLFFIGSFIHITLGIALAVMSLLFVIAIIGATQGIFISALYHRLSGKEIAMLSDDAMEDLFVTKPKKNLW